MGDDSVQRRVQGRISAPASVVWAVMTDVASMPAWTSSVSRVEVQGDAGPMGLGSRVRLHQPRLAPATWVVDGWTPGTRFSWTARAIGVRTTGTHVVEPVGADQCLVTLEIVHRGALAALVGRMTAAMTERYLRLELAGLTARAEARAGGEPPEV